MARIKKDKIPADELRLALAPLSAPAGAVARGAGLKTPVRGKLYAYRLLRADDIENFEFPWFLDLGFAGRCEAPPSDGTLNNKYLYTSEKIKDGYRLKVTGVKPDELFTFRGKLRRLIDGDTLLVAVDQGFSVWTRQRLRLQGIDAPELETLAGERAKKWLEDELKSSKNLVVKTYKTDQWDRYLVDVFYDPKRSAGSSRGQSSLNKKAEGLPQSDMRLVAAEASGLRAGWWRPGWQRFGVQNQL